ncbi:MAG: PSD1 and planctomycete cytochrome C domain-containing protein [Planctomycetota bacterium]
MPRHLLLTLLTALITLPLPCAVGEDFFVEQVAPVFSRHCAVCHNEQDSRGGFSLQDMQSFFDAGVIESGEPEESYLIELITSHNGQPPEMPKSAPALSGEEVDAIRTWIAEGARWPDGFEIKAVTSTDFDWWSLKPALRPDVPEFDDEYASSWIRTPVDAFVIQSLIENDLRPAPAADRRTLIRRLSYDLAGLPPTIEETRQFENDQSPDAYQRLVERLLASPRYGERWARHWLDVVKYADTCGYDKDKLRENAWPYRDYVIRSFNEDKPYARFVQEQIAGDVLFPGSPDGILGLGFIAAGPWDFIGHVEVPEEKIDGQVARNLDRDDMVTNTLNTFCSITVQCARCHDHKFDPFTQEHYYGLQAVFAAVDRADRVYELDPAISAERDSISAEIARYKTEIGEIKNRIVEEGGTQLAAIERAIQDAESSSDKKPEFGYHSQVATEADCEKYVEVVFEQPRAIERLVLRPCHDDFNGIGAGFGFPVRFKVELDGEVVFDQTGSDFPNPGLDPVVINVAQVESSSCRVTAMRLAERKGDYIFALAELQIFDQSEQDISSEGTVIALDSIEAPTRWSTENLNDGIWFQQDDRDVDALRQQRDEFLIELVGADVVSGLDNLESDLKDAESKLSSLPRGKLVYAAATDFPAEGNFKATGGRPREIRFLRRGDVTAAGEAIGPGALPFATEASWSFDLPDEAPEGERRAALAKWIVSNEHPLTWRSIVNRVWHYHFGKGIVDTPNDFGRMGGVRSHPELLDWLAVEFRDNGGSLKDLHRLIVMSSTYRQASSNPEFVSSASEFDSGNRLLWRMNRRRLSAEEIRDSILFASGQLNLEAGGPGYFLFELEKTEHSPHYEYHKFDHADPASYRRSVYRFIVRSQPDPYMTTLDCADSSQSTPARNETQTPLQSLTMLNSEFNLAMAQHLAVRVRRSADSGKEQEVHKAVEFIHGRTPDEEELELLIPYAEEHGLENLVRILFNTSEFVFVE